MVAIDNTKQAQETADKVKGKDNNGKGASDAYNALHNEVQDHLNQIGKNGYTQPDFQHYQAALVKDLVKNGTLPDLSLEWAKDNKSLLHQLSIQPGSNNLPDNGISHKGIDLGVNAMKKGFDGTLVQAYGDQLNKGGTFDAATAATGKNVGHDAFLDPESTKAFFNQESRSSGNRGASVKDGDQTTSKISQLFQGNILQQLDTAKHGKEPDGKISNNDINAWLGSHNASDPHYQLVKDINDGKYDQLLKKSKGTDKISDGFSVKDLSNDLGLSATDAMKSGKDYGGLANAFSNAHNGDQVPPPMVVKGPNGRPSQISYDNGRVDQFQYDANGHISQITQTPPEGGKPVDYKADDKGNWGVYNPTTGKIDASGGLRNPVITDSNQYAFQHKDGKWVVADDHGNFNPPAKDFSFKENLPKYDNEGNPILGKTGESTISVNTNSQVTKTTASDGSTTSFTYDAKDPTKLTEIKSTDFLGNPRQAYARGTDGNWHTAKADGTPTTTPAPFKDIAVDSSGTAKITNSDLSVVYQTPDNVNHKDSATGPVLGADGKPLVSGTPLGDKKLPFETKTNADGSTTFNLQGGDGHWLWNYAAQIAKGDGKSTQDVLEEIVKANRGKNGLANDATGDNVGSYEKGNYVLPSDLVPKPATADQPPANPAAGDKLAHNVQPVDGYISSVQYANHTALGFGYTADHHLDLIHVGNGHSNDHIYKLQDGKWVNPGNGQPAPFSNPVVEPDGTLTYTDSSGSQKTIKPGAPNNGDL